MDPQPDGVQALDERGEHLDDLLHLLLVQVLGHVLLHGEDDLGAAAQGLSVVSLDGEGTPGGRLPDVLLVIVVLGGDGDLVSDLNNGLMRRIKVGPILQLTR